MSSLFVALHGSAAGDNSASPRDYDFLVVLSSLTNAHLERLRVLRTTQSTAAVQWIPFSTHDIATMPAEKRLQFLCGCEVLYGSLAMASPHPDDLREYLRYRLFDRVHIRLRNWWLGQYEYYVADDRVLQRRLAKEIAWWWRDLHFVATGQHANAIAALARWAAKDRSSPASGEVLSLLAEGTLERLAREDAYAMLHNAAQEMSALLEPVETQ